MNLLWKLCQKKLLAYYIWKNSHSFERWKLCKLHVKHKRWRRTYKRQVGIAQRLQSFIYISVQVISTKLNLTNFFLISTRSLLSLSWHNNLLRCANEKRKKAVPHRAFESGALIKCHVIGSWLILEIRHGRSRVTKIVKGVYDFAKVTVKSYTKRYKTRERKNNLKIIETLKLLKCWICAWHHEMFDLCKMCCFDVETFRLTNYWKYAIKSMIQHEVTKTIREKKMLHG